MSTITITTRQQQKTDTSSNWTSNNPVLLVGEIGIESNTGKIKVGNGISGWNSLAYIGITTEYLQANYLPKSNPTVMDSITIDSTTDSVINKIQYAQTSPMSNNMGVKGVMLTTNAGGDEGGLLIHGDGAYLWNSTDSGYALKVMDEDVWSAAPLKKDATFTNGLLFSIDTSGNVKCKGKFYDTSGNNIVGGASSLSANDVTITSNSNLGSTTNLQTALTYIANVFAGTNTITKLKATQVDVV